MEEQQPRQLMPARQSPFAVGRQIKVRWPARQPDGVVFTGGTITDVRPGNLKVITVDLENYDGTRRGSGEFRPDELIIESSRAEG